MLKFKIQGYQNDTDRVPIAIPKLLAYKEVIQMNDFFGGYDRVVFETPDERNAKRKRQRRLFSRVFLALFIYVIISQFAGVGIYAIARAALSAEQYARLSESVIYTLLISSAAQYLIAFPVLLLALVGTHKAEKKEKTKLSLDDFILLFLIGEVLMFIGNLIGTSLNEVVGNLSGRVPENSIATIINETPIWLIFVLMVIVGPIVEELIFRKLLIDRLSIYSDKVAIIFSAVAFGLMHGNLYQFFYAALLGGLLGYVYTLTRDVKYTIYMHMAINFLGSVVALPVEKAMTKFLEIMEMAMLGQEIDLFELFTSGAVTLTYTNLQYGMIIGGIIALVHFVRSKKIKLSTDKEIFLPDGEIYKYGILNVGALLFISVCTVTMILNLIFV